VEQLHSIISIAKKRQWNKIYEVIMRRLVELCVDLKDHRTAKDGLHQYRNTVVNVRPLAWLIYQHFCDSLLIDAVIFMHII
jgi:translation initiation factor 3 subunit A